MMSVETMPGNAEYPRWVDFAINHEMKAVVAFALLNLGEPATASQIGHTVDEMQGSVIDINPTTHKQFCTQSLEPAGFVRRSEVEYLKLGLYPTTATGLSLTDQGLEQGISLFGDIARWSIDNPDLSLRDVMGVTKSRLGKEGFDHGTTRLHILSSLATYGTLSMLDLTLSPRDSSSTGMVIEELKSEGIVDVSSSFDSNDRTFRIVQPEYSTGERKRPFHKLVPEKQFMFRMLKIAISAKDVWTFNDFMNLAEAVDDNPESLKKLQLVLQNQLSPSVEGSQPYIKNESGPIHANGTHKTSVTLSDKHVKQVTEFVSIINEHLAGDSDANSRGVNNAFDIMEDQNSVVELIAKPRRSSALVVKDPQFDERLADIVGSSQAPQTAKQVHAAYEAMSNRKVGIHTVAIRLWNMKHSGFLQSGERKKHGKTTSAPVYSVN